MVQINGDDRSAGGSEEFAIALKHHLGNRVVFRSGRAGKGWVIADANHGPYTFAGRSLIEGDHIRFNDGTYSIVKSDLKIDRTGELDTSTGPDEAKVLSAVIQGVERDHAYLISCDEEELRAADPELDPAADPLPDDDTGLSTTAGTVPTTSPSTDVGGKETDTVKLGGTSVVTPHIKPVDDSVSGDEGSPGPVPLR